MDTGGQSAPSAARAARSPGSPQSPSTTDPILRNALRYTISAREYALLHRYVLSRSRLLKSRTPSVATVHGIMSGSRPRRARESSLGGSDKGKGKSKESAESPSRAVAGTEARKSQEGVTAASEPTDDFNSRAIRHSIRVFVATGTLMKLWDVVSRRLMGRNQGPPASNEKGKKPIHKSPTLRLSLSLSTILLLYRLLFRFFTRLRAHLLDPSAAPFRLRNPRTADTLTSPYAPAVGASLAGFALGIYPAQQLRVSVAIYTLFRALEFGWNCAEDGGMIWGWERTGNGKVGKKRTRPWWWGSWMLQPFAFGQLLHAAVFDRDCFPKTYGDFIFKNSTAYLHEKPSDYPANIKWPKPYEIVDNIAQMARLNWPSFISPVLFPNKEDVLPLSLSAISPLTSSAHPLITSLSCATLHPSDPSCTRTFVTFWLRSFPPLARFLVVFYSALLLPRFRSLYNYPVSTINRVLARALRMSTFLTGAISSAWASICLFQAWFPRGFLPTQRFFLGGFLAGFWAWTERRGGRGVFLYSARASLDSLWKVGVKRRWWRAMRGGDVWVFVAAVMLTGVVYERDARAIREGSWRKGVSWARGEGWRDWGADPDDVDDVDDVDDEDDEDDEEGKGEYEGEGARGAVLR